MEAITIFPKNEKQRNLLKTLLQELKVPYEEGTLEEASLSKEDYLAKIDRSIQQATEGKAKRIDKDAQREFLGL